MKRHLNAIRTIATYTALEAIRTRYVWLLGLVTLAGFCLAAFSGQLAITESVQIQTVLTAAILRFSMVFLLALFVITSVCREFSDKTVEMMLSLALPRGGYYLGKLAGYALIALLTALPAWLLVLYQSPVLLSVQWGLSLVFELLIVCTACLVFAFSFNQATVAISAFTGFYLLSRSIAAMQLMAQSNLLDQHSLSQQVITGLVNSLAYVLPDLDRYTRSGWLIESTGYTSQLHLLAGQTVIYLLLLSGLALFDLYRKNF